MSKVTAEDLVREIKTHAFGPIWLAQSLGWQSNLNDKFDNSWYKAVNYIAQQIDLPEPTIPGTINGTPATFEVVYRAEDCNL